MSDKQTQVDLGLSAKLLLENAAFQEALRQLDRRFYEEWRKTDPSDSAARERLYQHSHVQRTLVNCLNEILGNGQVSAQSLAAAKGKRQ